MKPKTNDTGLINNQPTNTGLKQKCWLCKKELPLDMFRKSVGGNGKMCKLCYNEYKKEWIKNNKEKDCENHKRWNTANKEKLLKSKRLGNIKYSFKNPEKILAQKIARRNRKLLLKDCCEDCGSTLKLEMHHPDYSKPLEVITLCRKCHTNYTFNIKNEKTKT